MSSLDMHVVDCRQVHGIYCILKSMGLCASVRDLFLQMSRPQWSRHGHQCVRDICTTQGKLAECEPSLKAKGQSEIWKRDEMEHQPGHTGNIGSWAGVVIHSWWTLWTAVCRVFNVNLFTLLTRDTLWTLDNCQQRSTAKTAHSFNGGSFGGMDYLHKTVKRMLFFLRPFKHCKVECLTRRVRHDYVIFFEKITKNTMVMSVVIFYRYSLGFPLFSLWI